jgi:hypothetical protein
VIRPPPIDRRTAKVIAGQLYGLLKLYAPEWKGAGEPGDFGNALVQIFARYGEIVIERLNRAPEKNLLAYLDMLGASLQPPQPARVPLAFALASGSTADAVVPAGTQAAAPPAEGEIAPVIFETERELVVVAATLDKIFVREVVFDRDKGNGDRSQPLYRPRSPSRPRRLEQAGYPIRGHLGLASTRSTEAFLVDRRR